VAGLIRLSAGADQPAEEKAEDRECVGREHLCASKKALPISAVTGWYVMPKRS